MNTAESVAHNIKHSITFPVGKGADVAKVLEERLKQNVDEFIGDLEAAKLVKEHLRARRDAAAPTGYEMRPSLSPLFIALREAYGYAVDSYHNAREAAGLPRFEYPG